MSNLPMNRHTQLNVELISQYTTSANLILIQPKHCDFGATLISEAYAKQYHENYLQNYQFKNCFMVEKFSMNFNPTEINRFYDLPRIIAEYTNDFHGVLCYDISDWVSFPENKVFDKFLEYCEMKSSHARIIFIVNSSMDKSIERLTHKISQYLSVKKHTLNFQKVDDAYEFITEKCAERKINLLKNEQTTICHFLENILKSSHFYGYKTLNRIVDFLIERKINCAIHPTTAFMDDLNSLASSLNLLSSSEVGDRYA